MKSFDSIVIGGGLAGATAARELGYRGHRVLLLEARDRLGGRGWTMQHKGAPIEMGGQNVHYVEPHLWAEIHRYGLAVREVPAFESYTLLTNDGRRTVSAQQAFREMAPAFEAFYAAHGRVISRPFDPLHDRERIAAIDHMSIQDRYDQLDLPPDSVKWFRPWLAMRCGGEPLIGSYLWMLKFYAAAGYDWQRMLEMSSRWRLIEGIGVLIKRILADSRAEVRLSSPVKQINDDGNTVHVTTLDGQAYSARTAVVATSANMWAHIDFASGLSETKLNASRTGMQTPHLTKLWAIARGKVENVYTQRPNCDHPIIHARKDVERPDGTTLIIGFSNDPTVDPNDKERVTRLFLETIPLPEGEIVDIVGQDWVADPWTRGGTSLLRPGQMSKLDQLRVPEGRIAFATADIANCLPGFDGAIETGIFAARNTHETLANARAA